MGLLNNTPQDFETDIHCFHVYLKTNIPDSVKYKL